MKTQNYNKNYHFAIFPLNCLSLKFSFKFLLQCIYNYYIVTETIRSLELKDDVRINYSFIREYLEQIEFIDYDTELKLIESPKNTYLKYKIINENNKKFEFKYGKDAKVQFHIELLTEMLSKNNLTERQFRILCAIYSKIGKSIYQFIYNYEIATRAIGYKSKEVFKKESKGLKIILYTKYILDKEIPYLKHGKFGRNFFDRILIKRRKYCYSKKYRGKQLEEIILLKLNRHKAIKEEERKRNNRFDKKLKEVRSRHFTEEEIQKLVEIKNKSRVVR